MDDDCVYFVPLSRRTKSFWWSMYRSQVLLAEVPPILHFGSAARYDDHRTVLSDKRLSLRPPLLRVFPQSLLLTTTVQ